MIEFADWSGLEIQLVYYPPYHRKYNRIERLVLAAAAVERSAADRWDVVKACAERMPGSASNGLSCGFTVIIRSQSLFRKKMRELNKRLKSSENLAQHDILVDPLLPHGR